MPIPDAEYNETLYFEELEIELEGVVEVEYTDSGMNQYHEVCRAADIIGFRYTNPDGEERYMDQKTFRYFYGKDRTEKLEAAYGEKI